MTKSNTSTMQTGSAAGSRSRSERGVNTVAKSSVPARQVLLAIGFVEGAAVMVVELLGAKIIAPFYGTSLYVWASVLGVTLGALALGYYVGGWLSGKYRTATPLFIVLGLAAVFSLLAPRIAPFIMQATADMGIRTGSFLSVLLYLLPPIACMGTVSPLITQLINNSKDNAGKSAGTVYAISTVGGILATFLAGFYLIPELGVATTSILVAVVLGLISLLGLLQQRRVLATVGIVSVGGLFMAFTSPAEPTNDRVEILHQSSGILGEWTVIDQTLPPNEEGNSSSVRKLLLNGIDQSFTEVDQALSLWDYPHRMGALASIKPAGSRALLLGMGAGSMIYNLNSLGFEVDVVELDGRLPDIAQQFFDFAPASAQIHIDDARHYLNETDQKYDVILFDMLNGEVQPWHVFTVEGLARVREVLTEDGIVIVNFQGQLNQEGTALSRTPRSVFKTFREVGFDMYFSENEDGMDDLVSDILLYGSPNDFDFGEALSGKLLRYGVRFPFKVFRGDEFNPLEQIPLEDAIVLTDDKPNLELLNAATILEWRAHKMKFVRSQMLEQGLPIYD